MTAALLPEMAQGTFQPLLDRLEKDRNGHGIQVDEVRMLLRACGFGAAVLTQCSEMLKGFLRDGVESKKFSFFLDEFTHIVERVLAEVYPRMRSIAEGESLPPLEKLASLRSLDEFSASATALRDEMAALQRWLNRPAPQVNIASFLAGKNGQYENLEDILARLKAGQGL